MIKYFLLWPLDTAMTIIAFILSPVLPFFAIENNGMPKLPKWLSWFDTPDNSLNGDLGHLNRHLKSSLWWQRTCWLARNRAYNFSIDAIGTTVYVLDTVIDEGDPLVSNRPIHSGWFKQTVVRTGAFQFYYVKQWSETKCIRLNVGWKIKDRATSTDYKAQYVFSFNPLMGLSK